MDKNTPPLEQSLSAQEERMIDDILQTRTAPKADSALSQRIIDIAKNTPQKATHQSIKFATANTNTPSVFNKVSRWFENIFGQQNIPLKGMLTFGAVAVLFVGLSFAVLPSFVPSDPISISDLDSETAALMIEAELFLDMSS